VKIAIYGVGGVGGYFGGRLAQAGHDTVFIARGAHLDAMRRDGLQVSSPKGDFVVPLDSCTATDDAAGVGVVDLILLGVKAGQVSDVAPAMVSMVGPGTVVVPLQNGVEAAGDLVSALGPSPVLGGLCRIVSSIAGPGRIAHAGLEPTIVMGELDRSSSERVERVRHGLAEAGITVEIPDDIHVALWQKLLMIGPWGGLGAMTRVTLDALCDTTETRTLLHQAMSEVHALAAAHEVHLPADAVEKTIAFLAGLPPGGTASMQRDIMKGRPSELESQIGVVVRLGPEKGVDTTVHSFVYESLLPGETIARTTN